MLPACARFGCGVTVAYLGRGTAGGGIGQRGCPNGGADGPVPLPAAPCGEGLVRHYREVAAATSLPVVVYQRDNAVFTPASVVELARTEGIVGLKDGVGDLDLMQRTVSAVRAEVPGDFLYFNGLPTAELTQLAYRGIGVTLYSSAVFCFAPEIALAFHRALHTGDDATVERLLDGFYRPFVELRAQGRGYAVSLVKAGVRLGGLDVGEVRPPLHEPAEDHVKQLARLTERGHALLEEAR
ncbi:putative 5-dehydro-4-deoxyglucarate dehydratase OS=Streptomyces fumanus OX=67302 GN=GCM10018772_65080 PE=3 SV=1 [Streptomyces fumanus]